MVLLSPEHQAWIETHVERGEFASIDDAVRQLLDERIAERTVEEGEDLAWAKPYVDEARAEVARGDVIGLEEHRARNAARLASFKD